jgi:hypothetical protein
MAPTAAPNTTHGASTIRSLPVIAAPPFFLPPASTKWLGHAGRVKLSW